MTTTDQFKTPEDAMEWWRDKLRTEPMEGERGRELVRQFLRKSEAVLSREDDD